jgi:hypothetical protein
VSPLPADVKASANVAAFLDYTATKAGVREVPKGSNRGPDIDAWAKEFGAPLGSFWCALMVGHTRAKFGLWIPPTRHLVASCDEWYYAAKKAGMLSSTPAPGYAVLYTNGVVLNAPARYKGQKDAVHIGTVLRADPDGSMSWEGNTTLGKYDRNGYVLALKEVDPKRVLAYVKT